MNEPQRCHNCLYSRTYEVVDIVLEKLESAFKTQSTITKCHLQGKPEIVNSKLDWCYQWNPSDPCFGELDEN
jgi:hypothetical protein